MKKSTLTNLFHTALLVILAVVTISMGNGEKKYWSQSDEPAFAPLEPNEGNFVGSITDGDITTPVSHISFFGHTSIGGIRKDNDDSFNNLDLAKTNSIVVINPGFTSKRYSDKEFILAHAYTSNGASIKNLLIPKNVTICGIDLATGAEKAWFLRKIKKIEIVGRASEIDFTFTTSKSILVTKDATTHKAKKQNKPHIAPPAHDRFVTPTYSITPPPEAPTQKIDAPTYSFKKKIQSAHNKTIQEEEPQTIWSSILSLIDAIINFIKAIFKNIFRY